MTENEKPKLPRFAVYSTKVDKRTGAVVWIRVGSAMGNRDGSFNVFLDALPLDGKLHARPETTGEGGT